MRRKGVWLLYDGDTALGINNEGELVFSYNLEDIDQVDGEDVFNGQKSVLWINLRQAFYSDIRDMYASLRSSGALSYAKVEKMFEDHQAKWPEKLFNADSKFKYLDPWTEGIYNEEGEFIHDDSYFGMYQGSKKSQRRWWMYNRFKYLDSKYNCGDNVTDYIDIRGYAKGDIRVTPAIDIYPSVRYGSYTVSARGEHNVEYTLECPLDNVNDTEIAIFSASQLKRVRGLEALKCGRANFAKATGIDAIILGSAASGYTNPNLRSVTIGSNELLKILDLRNCVNFTASPDLSGCPNVEEVYLEGTQAPGVTLPNGGVLKKFHLPASTVNLTIMNQKAISDFQLADYSNLSTIRLENVSSVVPLADILAGAQDGARLRLVGYEWNMADTDAIAAFYDALDGFAGMDETGSNVDKAQVYGTIHIASARGDVKAALEARYPGITIDAESTEATVYYRNEDESLIGTETVLDGADATGRTVPSKAADAEWTYTPSGWTRTVGGAADPDALASVSSDRTLYPAYTKTKNSYTVTYVRSAEAGGGTLKTESVEYGSYSTPPATDPTWGGSGTASDYAFTGWTPNPASTPIIGATTFTAAFRNISASFVDPGFDVSDAYAVQWDYSKTATTLARGGLAENFSNPSPATSNAGSGSSPFDSIGPWAGMKMYNVEGGVITVAEDEEGFSLSKDTVVKIPEFWYKVAKDTTNRKHTWAISPVAKDGYTKHPGSGKYVGRYHTTGSSSGVFTKTGASPLVNITRPNFRTYSTNKGTGWRMIDAAAWGAIQMLYLVEFADFNSQTALGKGWNTGSIAAVGGTDAAVYHTVKATGAHNQYRHIEDMYSNVYDFVDGFVASERKAYVGTDPADYGDTVSNLVDTGITMPSSGYITGLAFNDKCDFMFLPLTSSSTDYPSSYVSDKVFTNTGVRTLSVGGSYGDNDSYGVFFFDAYNSASNTSGYLGSRLLYEESRLGVPGA